jgi:hypothetical protein
VSLHPFRSGPDSTGGLPFIGVGASKIPFSVADVGAVRINRVVLFMALATTISVVLGIGWVVGYAESAGAARLPQRATTIQSRDCVGLPAPNGIVGNAFPGQNTFHAVGQD